MCSTLSTDWEILSKHPTLLRHKLQSKMAVHVREERCRLRQPQCRPRLFWDRENPLEGLPGQTIFQKYRFSPDTIMFMMTIVSEAASETMQNYALPPLMKLLLCLRYLASRTFHVNVGDSIGIYRQAAGLAIRTNDRIE